MTADPVTTTNEEAGPARAGAPTDLPEWRIAVRCTVCGSWLVNPQSVMRGMGPHCAQGGTR
jgi:hypothetical protein